MVKAWIILVAIVFYCAIWDYAEGGSIVDKIPKAFYPKLKKICDDIKKFTDCLVANSKKITPEAVERLTKLFEKHDACNKMPDPKDTAKFKEFLCLIAKDVAIVKELEALASEIKTLMKCTK